MKNAEGYQAGEEFFIPESKLRGTAHAGQELQWTEGGTKYSVKVLEHDEYPEGTPGYWVKVLEQLKNAIPLPDDKRAAGAREYGTARLNSKRISTGNAQLKYGIRGTAGEEFNVPEGDKMLAPGRYKVVGDKIMDEKSGMWGDFSSIEVDRIGEPTAKNAIPEDRADAEVTELEDDITVLMRAGKTAECPEVKELQARLDGLKTRMNAKYRPSVIKYPTGKYGLVGTIPAEYADKRYDTEGDANKDLAVILKEYEQEALNAQPATSEDRHAQGQAAFGSKG